MKDRTRASIALPLLAALAVLLTLPAAPSADAAASTEGLWLHVHVSESSGGGEDVRVNLPLSMVEKAIPMIPETALKDGNINWGGNTEMTVQDMRDLWYELRDSPDATFVTVDGDDEQVRVRKEGGYLLVDVDESRLEGQGEQVQVRIPVAVVDALFSGNSETLDIRAAIAALAQHGEGELVTVNDGSSSVRIWVDALAEAP